MKSQTVNHPTFKDLSFEAKFSPPTKGSGERNFSLGEPSEPAYWEIVKIFYKDQDVSCFLQNFCENLIAEFEGDLLESYPRGLKD